MSVLTPRGMIDRAEALNIIGEELFPGVWTGGEHRNPRHSNVASEERERCSAAAKELRARLAMGHLKAHKQDPWTGMTKPIPPSRWFALDAERLLERGATDAAILFEQFYPAKILPGPAPEKALKDIVAFLQRPESQTKSLTRDEQRKIAKQEFPNFRLSEKQWRAITKQLPTKFGRPRKSDGKV